MRVFLIMSILIYLFYIVVIRIVCIKFEQRTSAPYIHVRNVSFIERAEVAIRAGVKSMCEVLLIMMTSQKSECC